MLKDEIYANKQGGEQNLIIFFEDSWEQYGK